MAKENTFMGHPVSDFTDEEIREARRGWEENASSWDRLAKQEPVDPRNVSHWDYVEIDGVKFSVDLLRHLVPSEGETRYWKITDPDGSSRYGKLTRDGCLVIVREEHPDSQSRGAMTEDEIRSRLATRLAEKVGITPCESCGKTSWQSNSGVYFQSSCIEETDAIVFKASTRVQCASCSNRQRIGVFESLPCVSLA